MSNEPETRVLTLGPGLELTATVFRPAAGPRATVLLVPAMGVTAAYYAPLARWLAERGYAATTFDYRGIGRSRRQPLPRLRLDILDWAREDCAAALDLAAGLAPDRPCYWIGHSLGGQVLPFVPNRARITRAVTVAAGSGYWRENAPGLRWRAWWLWYVVVPLAMPVFGYFPGRRLRKVGDLPRGVMAQWRRWCLDPEYLVGVEGAAARARFAEVRTPILSLSFTDDEFMSARNIESLHGFYVHAPRTMVRIHPRDSGERRIGHFGFFRPRFAGSLWTAHLLPALG